VLINSTTFKHHSMRLSRSFERRHKAKCLAFWNQYVETQTAPPVDYSKATSQALLKQWQNSRDTTIDLENDFRGVGARYDKLGKLAASVERHQELIKNRVKAAMADAQLCRLPDEDGGFQWKGSNGSRRFTRKAKIHDN
jgi:predicted phage-related endonuclease